MKHRLAPVVIALVVSVVVVAAVSMTPYFAGDVAVARAVQGLSPDTSWATSLTRAAFPPTKYILMAATAVLAFALAGWKGTAIAIGAMVIEQYGGEASKALASRPRPSPELVAVVGRPSGFSFPSTFVTLFSVTFGTMGVLAYFARPGGLRSIVLAVSAIMLLLGGSARVVAGAHWPSDVVLTTLVCLTWLWATARVVFWPRQAA